MTIKLRLTLLFVTVVALILGALMVLLYEFSSYQRRTEFNKQLFSRALVAATVVLESDEMSAHALEPFRKRLAGYQLSQESIAIFGEQGETTFRSGTQSLTLTSSDRAHALLDSGFARSFGDTQEVFFPYEDNGFNYVVRVSAVDEQGLASLHRLGYALTGGFTITIAFVAWAGWWFASRAMAPIARTTARAEQISATDLHIRLDEGNGRDEISKLAHAFNLMLDRLERAFLWQRQFIANASHEIRTPLTALEGSLEVALMQNRPTQSYTSVLTGALDDTRRLRRLVNDLLLLARAESEMPRTSFKLLRLDDLLLSVLDDLHRRYPAPVVDVQLQMPEEDDESALFVMGDAGLLRVAIENVLENGMKYTTEPAVRHVRVTITGNGTTVRLTVANQGIAIPPGDLPHVFEPFYRGDNARSVPGTGIGLALVHTIVTRHDGTVTLESIDTGLTTLVIDLPGTMGTASGREKATNTTFNPLLTRS
ncbi:MAG: HAMP domain-containing protein [Bacteroidetes bacterium]|nr:HAMP domain-containing protein [Bacteroidota bacterium]